MKVDAWRFLIVVLLSMIAGIITGNFPVSLLTGMLLILGWHYWGLYHLLQWLRRGKAVAPPDLPGVFDEIAREFIFLRQDSKQRKKKLTRFLKRFQASTSALPDAVVVLGKTGVVEWANERAEEYLGIHWPEHAYQRISRLIPHSELADFIATVDDATPDRTLQIPAPGNSAMILDLRIIFYGKSQHLLVARDITRMHQVNQMRTDFIANASHELRTPLTVITGYLEALESDSSPDPGELRSLIRQMRTQAERMQRLIEDLLKLASLESSDRSRLNDTVPVPELLSRVHREAETVSGAKKHRFRLQIDQNLFLTGSREELYSAFSNLVLNAVHYSPAGGIIAIRWYSDQEGAHLEVEDSGEGIEAVHIPRLTERFYRVDKGRSRDLGGTGLGLAIVKHVLVRHQASLNIYSEPGKGSLFCCNFPVDTIYYSHTADRGGTS